jgi:hypothetical protein
MAPISAARAPRFVHFSRFSYCSSDVMSNSAAWKDPTTSRTADWDCSADTIAPESDFQSSRHDGDQACAGQPHQSADRLGNRSVAKSIPRQSQHQWWDRTKDRGSLRASRSRYRQRLASRAAFAVTTSRAHFSSMSRRRSLVPMCGSCAAVGIGQVITTSVVFSYPCSDYLAKVASRDLMGGPYPARRTYAGTTVWLPPAR